MMDNVIVLNARAVEEAQESVRGLRRLHDAGGIRLEAFALVERTEDGRIFVIDQAEDVQITGTAAGGVVGGIVGLLGGPVGLLIGGATGAVVGSLFDLAEAESSDDMLRNLAWAVPPGRAATIAVVTESAQTPVDAMASDLGIAVLRRTRAEVELQIAEAEAASMARRHDEASRRTIGERLRDIKEAAVDRR
jgi:uncharacterized membrane protein